VVAVTVPRLTKFGPPTRAFFLARAPARRRWGQIAARGHTNP
jgi:hypothetical protein